MASKYLTLLGLFARLLCGKGLYPEADIKPKESIKCFFNVLP